MLLEFVMKRSLSEPHFVRSDTTGREFKDREEKADHDARSDASDQIDDE
jgi:hypothetical protein